MNDTDHASLYECRLGDVYCAACDGIYGKGHAKVAHPKPGPFRFRQRRWYGWLVHWMYGVGIIGGSIWSGHADGWIVHGLRWRTWPRPYILGRPRRAWGRWPLVHRLCYGHWPETVWLGRCGVCGPWDCCGATGFDHAPDCPEATS